MRNQKGNPILEQFEHLLSEEGRYPEKHVDIFWNRDEISHKIRDVEVVFVPKEALKDIDMQNKYKNFNRNWTRDMGNSLRDWLKIDFYTPAGVFGRFLQVGFETEGEMLRALEEFAHIEECEWARQMLGGVRRMAGD